MPSSPQARILSCLKALAIGDAIGKQTEMLSRADVVRWYPEGVRGFEGPPGSVIPRYAGSRKWEWRVGETTDDTERTMAVAEAILRDGEVSPVTVGEELLQCRKSVHRGVKSYWEFHQAGDPARIAQSHGGDSVCARETRPAGRRRAGGLPPHARRLAGDRSRGGDCGSGVRRYRRRLARGDTGRAAGRPVERYRGWQTCNSEPPGFRAQRSRLQCSEN